ncbi:MAG: glycosyltransferase family 2 protein [Patescibacteria group bacterium]
MIKPVLSIIILNYHAAGLVKQCLLGLYNEHVNINFEVIVVDNASGDGCLDMVDANFPQVKTIQLNKNHGYAAGNNAGLKQAVGDYILILNPDVAVLGLSLDKLISFMQAHAKVGLAAPKLVNPDGNVQMSAFIFPTFWLPIFRRTPLGYWPWAKTKIEHYLMMNWNHQKNSPVDWLLGACLIARREAIEQVGLLDEQYFLYVEDTDWCRRFWEKNWQVYYVAEVSMVHYHQRQSADALFLGLFNKITWIHISSWLKYFKKWGLRVPHPAEEEK